MNGLGGSHTSEVAKPAGVVAQRSRELFGSDDGIVVDLLNKFHKRLKQEFEGQQEEFCDKFIRQHRAKVARISWKAVQQWCKWDKEGPVLMPDLTRIYYRKGNTEVVLQEFPPQIRLLRFKGALAKRASTEEELDLAVSQKTFTYSLALPYVIFIFKFRDGVFQEVKCAFSDRPLKKLDEKPLKPAFTNLDNTLKVCLGRDFNSAGLEQGKIAQQSAYILDYFWSSTFSDEWGQNFWAYRNPSIAPVDERLKTLDAWQAASIENSLFVVEDVNWLPNGEESFGDVVVGLFEDDDHNRQLQDDMYKQLAEQFTEELRKAFGNMIDSIDQKIIPQVSQAYAVDLAKQLSGEE